MFLSSPLSPQPRLRRRDLRGLATGVRGRHEASSEPRREGLPPRRGMARHCQLTNQDLHSETNFYIFVLLDFGTVSGQSWDWDGYARLRLEQRCMNQRN